MLGFVHIPIQVLLLWLGILCFVRWLLIIWISVVDACVMWFVRYGFVGVRVVLGVFWGGGQGLRGVWRWCVLRVCGCGNSVL